MQHRQKEGHPQKTRKYKQMKARKLIIRLEKLVELYGDLDVTVMQEHKRPYDPERLKDIDTNATISHVTQFESHVTDVACNPKDTIIIIGQELL